MDKKQKTELLYNIITQLHKRFKEKTKAKKLYSIEFIMCLSDVDFSEDKEFIAAVTRSFKPFNVRCVFNSIRDRIMNGKKEYIMLFRINNLNFNADDLPF